MKTQIATYNHINSVVTWALANSVPIDFPNVLGNLLWKANYHKANPEVDPDGFQYSELLAKPLTAIEVVKACDFLEENCLPEAFAEISKIKTLAFNMLPAILISRGINEVRERPEYKQADWCIQ
jgi:hypothetical protein